MTVIQMLAAAGVVILLGFEAWIVTLILRHYKQLDADAAAEKEEH